jgi:hypothetical protein
MKEGRNAPSKDAHKRLPNHLQQALIIAANILRRISEKRLDNSANGGLLNVVPTECGGNHDD